MKATSTGIAEEDARLLEFERLWFRRRGDKEAAIRDTFGISVTRYYQRLLAIIDTPEALAHDPNLVSRLLRVREQNRALRDRPWVDRSNQG